MADSRIERDRQKALSGVVDRVAPFSADGSAALLVTTTTVSTYPTSAASFYASNPTEIDGSEVEGGPHRIRQTRPRSSMSSTSGRRFLRWEPAWSPTPWGGAGSAGMTDESDFPALAEGAFLETLPNFTQAQPSIRH